jgi:sulfite reductase (NADPH) flavoprotein alpha-component
MFGTAIKNIFRKQTKSEQNAFTILYGSHSGNSEFIAKEAQKYFKKNGVATAMFDLAKYTPQKLSNEKAVLIVISTHGEGDPPDSAKNFFMNLLSDEAPVLNHLHYSVCALGDSSYEHFCKTGKDIDTRLEELGARRLFRRVDCDVDFQKAASGWISGVLSISRSTKNKTADSLLSGTGNSAGTYHAVLQQKYLMNKGSLSETYHLVLAVEDKAFYYQAGDSLCVVPQNPDKLVYGIISQLQSLPGTILIYEDKETTLRQLIQEKLELTNLSKGLLERYQKLTRNNLLQKLLNDESQLHNYMKNSDFLDLLTDFPFQGELQDLVEVFRKIQPRYYSVASATTKHPGEVHLIVKLVQAENRGRMRYGACSSYLNYRMEPGQKINIRVIKNERFHTPKDKSPVIMIASGTGIAPFRAFMEEKEAGKFEGDCWLFFGEKCRGKDFFYQKEWENWKNRKLLSRLDVAFSRDQKEKIYVQHKIKEQSEEFYTWLNNGAYVYICGSVKMGADVKRTIRNILEPPGRENDSKNTTTWEQLVNESRIREDVY